MTSEIAGRIVALIICLAGAGILASDARRARRIRREHAAWVQKCIQARADRDRLHDQPGSNTHQEP